MLLLDYLRPELHSNGSSLVEFEALVQKLQQNTAILSAGVYNEDVLAEERDPLISRIIKRRARTMRKRESSYKIIKC